MKKITFLLLTILLTSVSWRASAQYFTEGFEGTFPGTGWTHNQLNTAETWFYSTMSFHSGAQSLQCDYDAALGAQDEVMLSPVINLTSATNPRLKFWFLMSYYWGVDPNDNYDISVEATTDGGTTTTVLWTESAQGVFLNWTWYQVEVNLAAYAGNANFQLLLRYEGADGAQGNFDDILVEESPTCIPPTALTASSITTTSAVLGWTPDTSGSAWNIQWGPSGFALGSGTIVNGVTNPHNLSGLIPGMNYSYYVQTVCSSTETSEWAGPFTFTTLCSTISTFPWTEGFESVTVPAFPLCWFKENGDWVTAVNSGSSFDADAHTGTQFLRDSWSATNEFMWTPGFDLVAGTSYDFSFWWAGDNFAGWQGDVFVNNAQNSAGATQLGASFVALATTTTKTYAKVIRPFVPTTSGTYYFAIRANCPTSTPWYLSLDDFAVDYTPACVAPTALTVSNLTTSSASLAWTAGGSETSWNIEWGAAGFAMGSGTVVNGVTNPYSLSGLAPNTSYAYYVQAVCSATSTSTWSGPFTFLTPCTASDVPYALDFEDVTAPALPSCTQNVNEGTGNDWKSIVAPATPAGFTGNVIYYGYSTTSPANTWFFTNGLNLTAGTSYTVEYKYGQRSDAFPENLKVAFGTAKTGAAMTNVIADHFYISDVLIHNEVHTFTPTTSGVYYVGFHAYSDADMWNLYVDDIEVYVTPACPSPNNFVLDAFDATTATFSWNPGNTETAWEIVYGAPGFDPTTGGTVVPVSTNPYTLSGLTDGNDYDAYIRAVCDATTSSTWEGPVSWSAMDAPDCASNPTPADGATGVPVGLNMFMWDPAATGGPAEAYDMYYGLTASTVTNYVGTFTDNFVEINLNGFNTTFYWMIVPVNAAGEATGCAVWSFTTQAAPGYCLNSSYGQWPSAAYTPSTCDGVTENVICTDGYASEYSVVNVTAGETYQFKSSNATDFITLSADNGVTPAAYGTTPVTWTSTVTGPVRFYTHVDDQCTASSADRTRSVLCGPSLGTSAETVNGFQLYPNPVENTLTLKSVSTIDKVQVYNMLGQVVLSKNPAATDAQVDMTNLPTGSYIVRVHSGNQVGSYNIIKN